MSWSISLLVNTVKIPKKCAAELFEALADPWCERCKKSMNLKSSARYIGLEDVYKEFYCELEEHSKFMLLTGDTWAAIEEVLDEDKHLTFNRDNMEHMDYLSSETPVIPILCRHKVKGDICFGSLEGDNEQTFWGYRFDGKGGHKYLEGEIDWYVSGADRGGN
jgi:hypothetical protein